MAQNTEKIENIKIKGLNQYIKTREREQNMLRFYVYINEYITVNTSFYL